jgi:hypothetical protein
VRKPVDPVNRCSELRNRGKHSFAVFNVRATQNSEYLCAADLRIAALRNSSKHGGDGHSSGLLWWPVEERCSFAPSPELRLKLL